MGLQTDDLTKIGNGTLVFVVLEPGNAPCRSSRSKFADRNLNLLPLINESDQRRHDPPLDQRIQKRNNDFSKQKGQGKEPSPSKLNLRENLYWDCKYDSGKDGVENTSLQVSHYCRLRPRPVPQGENS